MTIGKLTAERLHAWDDESTQLLCDMVPSAHYVVDALGRRGVKSHNCVLSQWGHVSIDGQGDRSHPPLLPEYQTDIKDCLDCSLHSLSASFDAHVLQLKRTAQIGLAS